VAILREDAPGLGFIPKSMVFIISG
jgi:hypothetical protein